MDLYFNTSDRYSNRHKLIDNLPTTCKKFEKLLLKKFPEI